ncbi:co-chaperone GroES [candidate division WWE3 bacterium]|jgi:co-chaperonin GroES (HSP10)|nr:co-chaperone GroES [candidate division WWE3 bacterium]
MKPIGKNILVSSIDEEVKTDSGLLLSSEDTNDLRYKKALVEKRGTDVDVVSEGDYIYYDKRAGYRMVINSKQYTVISEADVVVVL